MSRTARFVVLPLLLALLNQSASADDVISPDGRIRFKLDTNDVGEPVYSLSVGETSVISGAKLGLRFVDHLPLDRDLEIVSVSHSSQDVTWEQPWGERRRVRDRHNEAMFLLRSKQAPRRDLGLRVRVFDEGVGFRYEVPKQEHYDRVDIADEMTEFRLPTDATAWWIPGRAWNRYEFLYKESGLQGIALANTPMTLKLADGTHVSLHEAALVDYAGYVLDQRRDGVFQTNLTPWSDGVRVKTATPFVSPWRTIQVSPDAKGLLNSDLILNLNEPNRLGDVSWVEPGKYIGIWWAMHLAEKTWGSGPNHGATTGEAKRYIDFAARYGFDGVLIEGWNVGWDGEWFNNGAVFDFTESYPDFDIQAVTDYAKEREVRLIGHHETSGHVSNYENQLEAALDLYESLGVRQVKTGYVADGGDLVRVDENGVAHNEWHDGQFSARHHVRVLEEAAARKISINTHEPIKDTGLRRTYPNWISREGARGQEFNAWAIPPNPPGHTTILPFTRMLSGPMDFTPGIFDLTFDGDESEQRVSTTLAKQLALYVVIYSPVQMAADLPKNYERFPDAFRFILDVPTDWEESIALDGEIGEFVVIARRQRGADDWYLGAISNESGRELSIQLDFLDVDRRYEATIYRDGDDAHWRGNPYEYTIDKRAVHRGTTLDLRLAAGGGAAIRFRPVDKVK
jgi:alpha-glucosidase